MKTESLALTIDDKVGKLIDLAPLDTIEANHGKNIDQLLTQLNVPESLPEQFRFWRIAPKWLKRFIIAKQGKAKNYMHGMVVLPVILSIMLVGIMLLLGSNFDNLFYLLIPTLFYEIFVMVPVMVCLDNILKSIEKVLGYSNQDKEQLLFNFYKERIKKYQRDLFDPEVGEFAKLDGVFQNQASQAETVYSRLCGIKKNVPSDTELYLELESDLGEAESRWFLVQAEHEKFKVRRDKVKKGLDQYQSKLDTISHEQAYIDIKRDMFKQQSEVADLITRSTDRYYQLAVALSDDIAVFDSVQRVLAPYSSSVSEYDPSRLISEVGDNSLIVAEIHSEELDKVIAQIPLEAVA